MRVIGWSVAVGVGLVAFSYTGNVALGLLSAPDDGAVLLGVALLGVLFGLFLLASLRGSEWAKRAGLLAVLLMAVGCTTVPAGYVGVKVNQWGTEKGVEDLPLMTGRIAYNPISTDVYTFPTFNQRVSWDADDDGDNDNGNESITFRSSENSGVNVDVGMNFHLKADRVPHIFLEYRQDLISLEKGYIRDRVQAAFGKVAGHMRTFDILGPKMAELTDGVLTTLKAELDPKGIVVDNVSILGKPRVDASVEQTINSVIQAQMATAAAEQRVRQVQAEAAQAIARAEGEAKSMLAVAEGEAEANRKITASLSDDLIRYRALGKWNGQLPQVTSGATPFIQVK